MSAEQMRLLGQAVTVPSPATQAIGEAARHAEMVVSIGVNERDGTLGLLSVSYVTVTQWSKASRINEHPPSDALVFQRSDTHPATPAAYCRRLTVSDIGRGG